MMILGMTQNLLKVGTSEKRAMYLGAKEDLIHIMSSLLRQYLATKNEVYKKHYEEVKKEFDKIPWNTYESRK